MKGKVGGEAGRGRDGKGNEKENGAGGVDGVTVRVWTDVYLCWMCSVRGCWRLCGGNNGYM